MRPDVVVELLYFEGCPGHRSVLPVLERLVAEAGAELRQRPIETPEEVAAERFLGSPSVRVNGVDVEAGADRRAGFGLECRLYRTADGLARMPPEEWIAAALAR